MQITVSCLAAFSAFVELSYGSGIRDRLRGRDIVPRQSASEYPAHTIDMPVRSRSAYASFASTETYFID
jgi:hypothetical protein